MRTQNEMMETYNYYNDSRVRSSMFSSCWSIVHEEQHLAIISFDCDFLLEGGPVGNKLEEILDKWVEDKEPFTDEYRKLVEAVSSHRTVMTAAQIKAFEKHDVRYVGSLPTEARNEMGELERAYREMQRASSDEHHKLWKKSNEEHFKQVCDELGFHDYHDERNDQHFSFCMKLSTKYEVCGQCSGSGKVVNPSIDCGGLSREDFDEDPEFEEAYFSGRYDITCPSCGGKRVESHPQFPEWLAKAIQDRDESVWEGIEENCAELRMGA